MELKDVVKRERRNSQRLSTRSLSSSSLLFSADPSLFRSPHAEQEQRRMLITYYIAVMCGAVAGLIRLAPLLK